MRISEYIKEYSETNRDLLDALAGKTLEELHELLFRSGWCGWAANLPCKVLDDGRVLRFDGTSFYTTKYRELSKAIIDSEEDFPVSGKDKDVLREEFLNLYMAFIIVKMDDLSNLLFVNKLMENL